jgi:hypothetical protein
MNAVKHKLYPTYVGIKSRCLVKSNGSYSKYGACH